MELAFSLIILIVSIILHEVAHGYMANYLGDPTARIQGRLTLNPVSHIDPFGSVILPAILVFTHSPILVGWAKPVPYNPYNLPGKYDETLVAFAGPATNISIAVLFGLIIRFFAGAIDPTLIDAFSIIVFVNLWLALFNLIPIPPLDGSKVLAGILPGALGRAFEQFRYMVEGWGMLGGLFLILLVFYFILGPLMYQLLIIIYILLTGVAP